MIRQVVSTLYSRRQDCQNASITRHESRPPHSQNQTGADGFFDFVEGYTVTAADGRIYFPVVEPFGSHLRKAIGNDALADKYVFQELYDSTRTVARQTAEKNKYRLTGEYRASNANEIDWEP